MPRMSALAKPSFKTLLALVAGVLASLLTIRASGSSPGPASTSFDPAFEAGLAALRKATGIVKGVGDQKQADTNSDLQLLIGVKATEGAKRSVYFVELTTIRAHRTNSVSMPSDSVLYTNRVSWPGPAHASHTNMPFEFVYSLAPLRVRVFDENARLQKQGQTVVPWELMTNSLANVCRICLDLQAIQAIPEKNKKARKRALEQLLGGSVDGAIDWAKVMRPVAGGVLTVGGLLAESLSTPTLNEIRDKAEGVIRLPGAWAMLSTAFGGKLDLALDPRFLSDVAVVKTAIQGDAGVLYRFPADLKNGKRTLVSVEFVVGPSTGAEVMVAGIRYVRAVHPTRPDREFVAQVLAAGIASDEPLKDLDSAK
ncbi:MAG TPA: hypothetical protein VKY92_01050 [Verrucomicrobiae bacterium]|jgi:hypothetical protein|nr:hypothetical protein [Verrucomicrobiae bacterium]